MNVEVEEAQAPESRIFSHALEDPQADFITGHVVIFVTTAVQGVAPRSPVAKTTQSNKTR